jgi:hypothetical protein
VEAKIENEFLTPGYPPVNFVGIKSWETQFTHLASLSSRVVIVTGYASEKSLDALREFVLRRGDTMPSLLQLDFVLGLAYFDGLTERQIVSLSKLDSTLQSSRLGRVYIPTSIGVHSKCVSFQIDGLWQVTLGSSNFTAFLPQRRSEADILLNSHEPQTQRIVEYCERLLEISRPLDKALINHIPRVKTENVRLAQTPGVTAVPEPSSLPSQKALEFRLPLKAELKSNLNKFNAAPRGTIPRSWWEVEIIVPTETQKQNGFPSKVDGTERFRVYTNDGYSFECHVSGGEGPRFNKNFESSGDLKILGYWLKGILVESGALSEGDFVTEETLRLSGFRFLQLRRLTDNEWHLSLGKV